MIKTREDAQIISTQLVHGSSLLRGILIGLGAWSIRGSPWAEKDDEAEKRLIQFFDELTKALKQKDETTTEKP